MMVLGKEFPTGDFNQERRNLNFHHRGQILIAIKTEISDSIDTAPSEVEVEQTQTINEVKVNSLK